MSDGEQVIDSIARGLMTEARRIGLLPEEFAVTRRLMTAYQDAWDAIAQHLPLDGRLRVARMMAMWFAEDVKMGEAASAMQDGA